MGCQIEDLLQQIFSKDLLLYTLITPRNRAKESNPNWTLLRRVPTHSQGRRDLPERQDPQWVPDKLDLQMATRAVGIYKGQHKEQGQPIAKSGANDRFSGDHAQIAQVL